MYSNLLLCVDGSEPSKKAAIYAIELAKLAGAKVHLIHVVDLSVFSGVVASPRDSISHLYGHVMDEAQSYLNAKEELCMQNNISCEKHLVVGHPANEIVSLAEGKRILM
jgi:nucleotide-binding universal stress UspA family protein